MSSAKPPFTGQEASEAMLKALVNRIRESLKERILERIQPDIDAAIDASLESFQVSLTSFHQAEYGRDAIRILIERKDKGDAKA